MAVQLTIDELEETARALAANESGVYGADVEGGVSAIAFALLAVSARLGEVLNALLAIEHDLS